MRKIAYELEIGFVGCGHEDEMEIADDMTNDEIDSMVHEMAMDWAQSWEGDERLGEDWDEEGTEAFYEGVYGTWKFVEEDEA